MCGGRPCECGGRPCECGGRPWSDVRTCVAWFVLITQGLVKGDH